jgi:toluene monooxygenase system ferredoxin subunit
LPQQVSGGSIVSTEFEVESMSFRKVSTLDDLWSGEMSGIHVDGRQLLLVNVEGVIHAYADACPHQRSLLSKGSLEGKILTCPTHFWEFDVSTGRGINPRGACLAAYAVRVQDGDIFVELDKPAGEKTWASCGGQDAGE